MLWNDSIFSVRSTNPLKLLLLSPVPLPLRKFLHDLPVSFVRRRLDLLHLALLLLQQLLHGHPERVGVLLLSHATQWQSPRALVHGAQFGFADVHDLPIDVLLLVVVLRQRGLLVPQVVQPGLSEQCKVEALETQVGQPFQAVLSEVLQVRVELRNVVCLLHDDEARREAMWLPLRLLLRVGPAGIGHDGLGGGE